jgi:hypothetical protein
MPEYHLHYIDGSDNNDHRSIGDFDYKDLDEAIKEVLLDYFDNTLTKSEIKEIIEFGGTKEIEIDWSDPPIVKHLEDKMESGFNFGVSVEEIDY